MVGFGPLLVVAPAEPVPTWPSSRPARLASDAASTIQRSRLRRIPRIAAFVIDPSRRPGARSRTPDSMFPKALESHGQLTGVEVAWCTVLPPVTQEIGRASCRERV